MIDRSPETIITKLVIAGGGITFLTIAFSFYAAIGFMCLLSVFTWELRSPRKDR